MLMRRSHSAVPVGNSTEPGNMQVSNARMVGSVRGDRTCVHL